MKELICRKNPRLKNYDYSTSGMYFVTVCVKDKEKLLGKIVGRGLAPAENKLTKYGKIADKQILQLEQRFQNIKIDKYIIMPNHIHMLIQIQEAAAGASPRPTVSDVVCAFKSLTTRQCRECGLKKSRLFQASFHDHIIRGEEDYLKIWEYINSNALKWNEDCYYVKENE